MLLALGLAGGSPAFAQDWARHGRATVALTGPGDGRAVGFGHGASRHSATLDVVTAIRDASDRTGVDFRYLLAQAHLESSLNPNAQAQTSSARGLYQFIDSTWLASLERNGARFDLDGALRRAGLADGEATRPSRAALLELRSDATFTALLAAALARENAEMLAPVLGRAPTGGELYLADFLGSSGAARFLRSWQRAPEASAAALFPREARSNRAIFYARTGVSQSLDAVLQAITNKVNSGIEATAYLCNNGHSVAGLQQIFSTHFPLVAIHSSSNLSGDHETASGLLAAHIDGWQAGQSGSTHPDHGLARKAASASVRFEKDIRFY